MATIEKNPKVVTVTVGNKTIQTTTEHEELTKGALQEVQEKLIEKGKEISKEVGENWYPCGFAKLNVGGRSNFVRFFKKNGKDTSKDKIEKSWKIGRIEISKNDYSGGYDVYFDFPATNPTEHQSLNFKRPLYNLFQDLLGYMGVETRLVTRID